MRKLAVMAALLFVAGAAYADDKQSMGSTQQETKEAGQAAARDTKQAAGEAARTAGETGQSMQQSGEQARENAQASREARDQMKKDDFNIKGKVAKVSKDQLTLSRDEAPAATLHVDKLTKVEVDGKTARLSDLKPGQDVKASFNLKGDKPLAIEVKADTK